MMSLRAVPWESVEAFLAVMTTGSLSAAARARRLAQPTVRRRIDDMERQLGAALFVRGRAGLVPTDVALRLLPHAEAMASAASAFQRAASGDDQSESGAVRITCSTVIGVEILPGCLAALIRQYPGLTLELAPTDRVEDLLRRDADIAVRLTAPEQAALVTLKLSPVVLGFYAAPAYVAEHGQPSDMVDLCERHLVVTEDRATLVAETLAAQGLPLPRRHVLRSDDSLAQLAAIRAGLGIGITHAAIAKKDGLAPVLPDLTFALPAWLCMHEDLRHVRRVRLVFDHLARTWADLYGPEPVPGPSPGPEQFTASG